MKREKGHVGTHCVAEACAHHTIILIVDIVVYTTERDVLTADFPSSLREADVIVGFLSRSAIEPSIEKDSILFNRVGKMITLQ